MKTKPTKREEEDLKLLKKLSPALKRLAVDVKWVTQYYVELDSFTIGKAMVGFRQRLRHILDQIPNY